jgi:hypothetical protein
VAGSQRPAPAAPPARALIGTTLPSSARDERLVEWKKEQSTKLADERVTRYDPNKDPLVEVRVG